MSARRGDFGYPAFALRNGRRTDPLIRRATRPDGAVPVAGFGAGQPPLRSACDSRSVVPAGGLAGTSRCQGLRNPASRRRSLPTTTGRLELRPLIEQGWPIIAWGARAGITFVSGGDSKRRVGKARALPTYRSKTWATIPLPTLHTSTLRRHGMDGRVRPGHDGEVGHRRSPLDEEYIPVHDPRP